MSNQSELAQFAGVFSGSALSNRNLLINSGMQVAQRGTSSTSEGYQTVDRFRFTSSDMDQRAFTQSQDTTGPSGFTNSYKITVTTPETTTEAEEQLFMFQAIEAQNLQQLGYGTSDAKQLTLSFWVKSSVTGAYCVAFYENDGNRLITSTYSISSANTWEYKTITIDGDTSGTINNDNGAGLELYFFLSVGPDRKTTDSTSWGTWTAAKFGYGQVADVAATSSATWQITGIQLEVGDVATPFEYEDYGTTLQKCQRYYQKIVAAPASPAQTYCDVCNANQRTTTASYGIFHHPVPMRQFPTLSYNTLSNLVLYMAATSNSVSALAYNGFSTTGSGSFLITTSAFGAAGNGGWLRIGSATDYIAFDAEL